MKIIKSIPLACALTFIFVLIGCKGVSNNTILDTTEIETTPEVDPSSGECPFSGSVKYAFKNGQTWPNGSKEILTKSLDEAVWYYNCYSNLSHNLTINYKPGIDTAEGNVDGLISFGNNQSYMVVATAMHEIGHTMGVGYYPFTELTDSNKRWTGAAVKKIIENIPQEENGTNTRKYITADTQHFWPFGLNQASEHEDEWSLINHVRIVAAMQEDKKAFLGK